jgi:hypothetical protein
MDEFDIPLSQTGEVCQSKTQTTLNAILAGVHHTPTDPLEASNDST